MILLLLCSPALAEGDWADYTFLTEFLSDPAAKVQPGAAGCGLRAVQQAVELLEWGAGTSMTGEEAHDEAEARMEALAGEALNSFREAMGMIDDACVQLIAGGGQDMLRDAGCESAVLPNYMPAAVEAILRAAGLRGGESAPDYRPILDKYFEAASGHWDMEQCEDAGLNISLAWIDDPLSEVGYTLLDVDYDGTPELLIGQVTPSPYGQVVYDLYTWDGSAPVMVFQGWDRNDYQLRSDYTFYNRGSSSAFESVRQIYYLDGTCLSLLEGVYYNSNYDEQNPWFLTLDDDWDASNDARLTEQEAENLIGEYGTTLIRVQYTPLKSKNW